MNKLVKCPSCQTTVEWCKDSPFRPFCSKRCQLIDLGDWASEKHAIAGEETPFSKELSLSNDNER